MTKSHSPQCVKHAASDFLACPGRKGKDLILKIRSGKGARCVQLTKDDDDVDFKVSFRFADLKSIHFVESHSEPPYCAIFTTSQPDIIENKGSACDELRSHKYPSWLFFQFNSDGLKKLRTDIESEPELASRVVLDEDGQHAPSPVKMTESSPGGCHVRDTMLESLEPQMQSLAMGAALVKTEGIGGEVCPGGGAQAERPSVVRVLVLTAGGSTRSVGSGCVVARSHAAGYEVILTAAHVLRNLEHQDPFDCADDASLQILIAPLVCDKEVPEWRYRARCCQMHVELDLATLLIIGEVQTSPVAGLFPRDMGLRRTEPFSHFEVIPGDEGIRHTTLAATQAGSAKDVRVGDSLVIWGFPIAGSDTVTCTRPHCDGFMMHEGEMIALKAHGQVDNGFSGGPVMDTNGRLIGVMSCSISKIDCIRPVDAAADLIQAACDEL